MPAILSGQNYFRLDMQDVTGQNDRDVCCLAGQQSSFGSYFITVFCRIKPKKCMVVTHFIPIMSFWLILFKVSLLTYKVVHGFAPAYLNDLLTPYAPKRNLCSATKGLLVVLHSRSCTQCHAFSLCAPKIWNMLPLNIRYPNSVSKFKFIFKMHFV